MYCHVSVVVVVFELVMKRMLECSFPWKTFVLWLNPNAIPWLVTGRQWWDLLSLLPGSAEEARETENSRLRLNQFLLLQPVSVDSLTDQTITIVWNYDLNLRCSRETFGAVVASYSKRCCTSGLTCVAIAFRWCCSRKKARLPPVAFKWYDLTFFCRSKV